MLKPPSRRKPDHRRAGLGSQTSLANRPEPHEPIRSRSASTRSSKPPERGRPAGARTARPDERTSAPPIGLWGVTPGASAPRSTTRGSRSRSGGWAAGCLTLFAALLGENAALASPPRVLVLPYQNLETTMPKDLGGQLSRVIERELSQLGLEVVQVDAPKTPPPKKKSRGRPTDAPRGDRRAGRRAERRLARARSALEEGNTGAAIRQLEGVIGLLEDNGDALVDFHLLPEAYLELAIALIREGVDEGADEALAFAIHFDPERVLLEADYPPLFLRIYDRARYGVLSRERGRVEVRAAPESRVLIDGRTMGTAPLRLEKVLPGEHWLRVERAGGGVQARKIDVRPGETTVVRFDGAPKEDALAAQKRDPLAALGANRLSAKDLEALAEAGRRARADYVLVGAVFATDVDYQLRSGLLDPRSGVIGRARNVAVDLDLLSMEIEVFKLAEDAHAQVLAGAIRAPASSPAWVPAPDFRGARPFQRESSPPGLTVAQAAPPPIPEPGSIYAKAPVRARDPVVARTEAPTPVGDPVILPSLEGSAALERPKSKDNGDLWWVWVIVGVAAAGAAGAATYALVSGDGSDEATLKVRW